MNVTISEGKVRRIIVRDGANCHYCGKPLSFDPHDDIMCYRTIDHVKPLIQGGTNNVDNLVLSCKSCNSRKHTKHYQEVRFRYETDAVILFLMGGGS